MQLLVADAAACGARFFLAKHAAVLVQLAGAAQVAAYVVGQAAQAVSSLAPTNA